MKLTGAAMLVSRGMKVLQAAPAAYPYRSAAEARDVGNRRARELTLRQAEEADWERVRTQPRPAHGDVHARGIGIRRLQLIVAPSFEEVSVWELRQGQEWQLIRPRVFARVPTLMLVGHDVVPFSSSALAAYFERVTALTLPLRPDLSGYGGADGTMHELAVYGDLSSAWRFQWWSSSPEQWRPMVELAAEMHAAFTAARGAFAEPSVAPDCGGIT